MLEDTIYKDYLAALKNRDKPKIEFLSFIRAELKNSAINLKKEKLDDSEALAVLKRQKKRLQETKESVIASERMDILKDTEKELALLGEYLPKPLREEELLLLVNQAIAQLNASSLKDMGRVIKEVLEKSGGRADSRRTSELVKDKLSKNQ